MSNNDLPEDIQYQCGDCHELRERENIKMVEHENEKLGEYPICQDKPCSIDNVNDPTTNEFRVEEKLE